LDTIVWDPHDTEAVVLACYEFYGVQHPYWSPTYQRPNWR